MSESLPPVEEVIRQFLNAYSRIPRDPDHEGKGLRLLIITSRREGAEAMRERCCDLIKRELPSLTAAALEQALYALPLD